MYTLKKLKSLCYDTAPCFHSSENPSYEDLLVRASHRPDIQKIILSLAHNFPDPATGREFWTARRAEHIRNKQIYRQKPDRVRQDNKSSVNFGNGRGHRGKIRVPKRCRKSAWKKFLKLFPGQEWRKKSP